MWLLSTAWEKLIPSLRDNFTNARRERAGASAKRRGGELNAAIVQEIFRMLWRRRKELKAAIKVFRLAMLSNSIAEVPPARICDFVLLMKLSELFTRNPN